MWTSCTGTPAFAERVPVHPDATAFHPSVIIPARNEAGQIRRTIEALHAQDWAGRMEIILVDDGSGDTTGDVARGSGARVMTLPGSGNPGRARNRGAELAAGDPLVFLDADCVPSEGWLDALLGAHAEGAAIVGGALAMPENLPLSARCDYYATSYHMHPRQRRGTVANHTPANLSVRREVFLGAGGYEEAPPMADGHEELAWQHRAAEQGHAIHFEPTAIAWHRNRPGVWNLLRRGYRWGYSSLESKASAPAVRGAWLYRHPRFMMVAALPGALAFTAYITLAWLRAGRWEILWLWPGVLLSRLAYAAGTIRGGLRWLARRGAPDRPVAEARTR